MKIETILHVHAFLAKTAEILKQIDKVNEDKTLSIKYENFNLANKYAIKSEQLTKTLPKLADYEQAAHVLDSFLKMQPKLTPDIKTPPKPYSM
jgi:protein-arginine kinase activator protein McsA